MTIASQLGSLRSDAMSCDAVPATAPGFSTVSRRSPLLTMA
jgi:hypothetical protein